MHLTGLKHFLQRGIFTLSLKNKPYILHTDESLIGLSAALCQEDDNEDVQVVDMASRTLKGPKKNYFITHE